MLRQALTADGLSLRNLDALEKIAASDNVSVDKLMNSIVDRFILQRKANSVTVSSDFMDKVLGCLTNKELRETGSWLGEKSARIARTAKD